MPLPGTLDTLLLGCCDVWEYGPLGAVGYACFDDCRVQQVQGMAFSLPSWLRSEVDMMISAHYVDVAEQSIICL